MVLANRRRWLAGIVVGLMLICALTSPAADEASDAPKPIPATRPELKAALEALKLRRSRIPLPAPGTENGGVAGGLRWDYMPESWGGGGGLGSLGLDKNFGPRGPSGSNPIELDELMSDLSFWVVSRGNNCQYCLGHQELKLRVAGLDDDTIAALDSNWARFDPRQQAVLAFARKLTLEPHLIGDADVAALKKRFTDAEVVELAFDVARFNAANRWTDGIGLPQERYFDDEGERTLLTPTSARYRDAASVVTPDVGAARPAPPAWEEVSRAMDACRNRRARVALPNETTAAAALAAAIGDRQPLQWERAMAQLPGAPAKSVAMLHAMMTDEHLSPRLKAELALISAVNNRAWYAAAHALRRLHALGVGTRQAAALFDEVEPVDGRSAAWRLAGKLTAAPHLITDNDIARVREHFSDAETAQMIHVISMANFFDRLTESLGLPLEE
jgi:alkylhydroperoxidase family enzyme